MEYGNEVCEIEYGIWHCLGTQVNLWPSGEKWGDGKEKGWMGSVIIEGTQLILVGRT